MKFDVAYSKEDILKLIADDIADRFNVKFEPKDIKFEVITRENYRAKEWERGDFRAKIELHK
jgi:hypothetical protein